MLFYDATQPQSSPNLFPFWYNRFALRFHALVRLHGHMEELWGPHRRSPWAMEKPRSQVQSWILTSEGLSQYPTSDQMHEWHKPSARCFDRLRAVWQSEAHGVSKWKPKMFMLAPSRLTGCVSPEREAIWEPLCSPWAPAPRLSGHRGHSDQRKRLVPYRRLSRGSCLHLGPTADPQGVFIHITDRLPPTSGHAFIRNEASQIVNSRRIRSVMLHVNLIDPVGSLYHDLIFKPRQYGKQQMH